MRPTLVTGGAAILLAGAVLGAGADAGSSRYVIYLHGKIVQEEQSARPHSPQFGFYELDKILETFRQRGFIVTGEIRPKGASVSESADRVVEQVRRLLASGVPADHVTIVGGSMGAEIALRASAKLQNREVRYGLLGACLSETARELVADEGKAPSGRVLSIREKSDEFTSDCPAWRDEPKSLPQLAAREMVLETGLRHGFLYRPLKEWVDPVVEWANGAISGGSHSGT